MAEKLKMQSSDVIGENISFIESRWPNAVKEILNDDGKLVHAIDFDVLKQELSRELISEKQERYQMTWPDKKKSILAANSSIAATLRPMPEKSIDFNDTNNIYIEGDNLDVLKLLRETYLNKIKMIYIDPPYNTGKDFIYNDDFAESSNEYLYRSGQFDEQGNRLFSNNESNGRFHTDWLNMMYPRLKIARDLLKEDGVIFISIDDNELNNLLKVCGEIFGENNYIGSFAVENNPKGRKNSKFISVSSEYCVVYAKDISNAEFVENIPKNANDLVEDEDGNFVHNSGKRVIVGENDFNKLVTDFKSNKHFSCYYNPITKDFILLKENDISSLNLELVSKGYDRYYSYRNSQFVENTYSSEKIKEMFSEGRLEFKNGKIYEKNLSTTIRIKSILVNREYDGIVNGAKKKVVFDFKTTSAGTKFKELFNTDKVFFTAPKNVSFIKLLISLVCKNDDIVLDFFSGSGTTGHAVFEENEEKSSNIKFILVQLPELCGSSSDAKKAGYDTICDIGEERIRRAGKKIKEENPLTTQDLDVGFRVLKLDSSNMKDVYYNPKLINQDGLFASVDNVKEDRTSLDLLFQVMLELGIELSAKITEMEIDTKQIFVINDSYLVACFASEITENVIRECAKINPVYVVFRDNSFAKDSDNINCEQIIKTVSPSTELKVI